MKSILFFLLFISLHIASAQSTSKTKQTATKPAASTSKTIEPSKKEKSPSTSKTKSDGQSTSTKNEVVPSPSIPNDKTIDTDKFCAKLWEHLANWGNTSEEAAAKVELTWYEDKAPEGSKEVSPGLEIKGPTASKELDETNIKNESENIHIPLTSPPTSEVSELLKGSEAQLKATTADLYIKSSKGRIITQCTLSDPDSNGDVWGKIKIGNKRILVKFSWQLGKFDRRKKFIAI